MIVTGKLGDGKNITDILIGSGGGKIIKIGNLKWNIVSLSVNEKLTWKAILSPSPKQLDHDIEATVRELFEAAVNENI